MGKRLTIALAVFALVVVPLVTYAAGYFLLPETYYKCYGGYVKARERLRLLTGHTEMIGCGAWDVSS